MSLWAYLEPEARAEVIAVLQAEVRTSRALAMAIEFAEELRPLPHLPRWSGSPARWHRLRTQWFEAAIDELGGDIDAESVTEPTPLPPTGASPGEGDG